MTSHVALNVAARAWHVKRASLGIASHSKPWFIWPRSRLIISQQQAVCDDQPAEAALTGGLVSSCPLWLFILTVICGVVTRRLIFQRVFILAERRAVARLGHSKSRREIAVEKARTLELREAGQIANGIEAEMLQKGLGGSIGDRPSRSAPGRANEPSPFREERRETPWRYSLPGFLLDFGPCDWLVIGDNPSVSSAARESLRCSTA